ncbi:TonB family protein [Arenimonas sp. GDDSR-1]|uniref:TonB family protein n=1 Tax=Arenimonas sp. GDDSR-1 TaxID=2950125 RepID=UPI0026322DA3|nr:TonB family protein [Arenimonas sp. GDDSR-1]
MFSILLLALMATQQTPARIPESSRPLPPAPPVARPAFLARDDSGKGVFESGTGSQNATWLADRFAEASWQSDNALRTLNGNTLRQLDEYKKSHEYSAAKQMLNMMGRWKAGNKTHTWVFDAAGPQGGMPLRALELEDLSGVNGYHVRATVHCYDAADTCEIFSKRQSELLAPKPQETAGELASRQWRNLVFDETCIERPATMDHPRYPLDTLREGKGGTVFIGILFNRCGNVRDSWILQSSGHRSLDLAAVGKALEWQLDLKTLPPDAMEKRMARIPIRFEVGDSLPPD